MRYPVTLLLSFFLASSLFAANEGKTRAVQPLPEVSYYGRLADLTTGAPVIHAEVTNGKRVAVTDANGVFVINLPAGRPAMLFVTRSGYETLTFNVTPPAVEGRPTVPVGPQPQPSPGAVPPPPSSLPPVLVTPKVPVTIRNVDGYSTTVDVETLMFGYVLPFASPATAQTASFCKTDGAPWTPDRSEFARIVGPAQLVRGTACCPNSFTLSVVAEMKNGDRVTAYFSDACFGYDVVLVARDHVTAQPVSISFTTIAEVTFP